MADEVADRVRDAIYAGVYAPGAPLREVELATALRVSRGPVREALLRLEREGLVSSEWHRGTTVTTLTAEDVDELYSLREALEELAVQRLIRHATDAQLRAVRTAADRMDGTADKHTTVQQDLGFHDAVFAAANHRRLDEAWRAIRSQVHLFLLIRLGVSDDEYARHVATEHRELADVLIARDKERALRLFADHRRHAAALVAVQVSPDSPRQTPNRTP
ncbi:GntR family transcriptional regulator [Actinoplanes sp. NBRC 103695]|nr:GntR family transcriptional regulator [Actinoplanes sp. NBRC 103695]